jgi:hypothetical protein
MVIRWKHRIDVFDDAGQRNEGEPFEQRAALHLERRQPESIRELEALVGKQLKGKLETLRCLALIFGRLARQAVHRGTGGHQLGVVIAKTAGREGDGRLRRLWGQGGPVGER